MTTPPHPPGHDPLAAFDNDAAIPMLTEVIDLAEPAQAPVSAAAPDTATALPRPPEPPDWRAIEERVRDDVLERLARRMDTLFTQRLDEAASAALDRAARQLATELRGTLAELAHDLVARAVAEEITRAQLDAADRDADPF
jgi:hypothetical protein